MPISPWAIKRPKFSDDKIHIPRPPMRHISHENHRWMECRSCQMPQVLVDMRWAGKGMRIAECTWCNLKHKVRITSFGNIRWLGIFR